jgi:SP family general alpha glucoside:H+ symporter-like MFS transporter
VDVKAALAVIIETDRVERKMQIGSSYLDCFRGTNLRRTNISIAVMSIQVFSGIYLASYATFFFEVAGLPTNEAFNLGVGFIALGFLATVLSWFVLSYAGRRTLYNVGLATLTIIQFVIGGLDCAPNYSNRPGIAWAESVLMLVWYFVYSLSIGPIAYVILCEVSAVRVRAKTIAISLAVEALATILMTVIFPYMINPDEANMRGKVGFFFGGLALLCLAWSWTSLPELRGRTYYEADVLFNQNIKTKDFPKTIVTAMKDVKEGNQPITIAVIKEGDV